MSIVFTVRQFGDSEGFVSSPLDGQGARHKDLYHPMSDENTAELRDTDAELRRLKTVAAEKDVDEAEPGEINVGGSGKLVGLLEDQSCLAGLKN